jgi:long-chain acyl-CoA synthetase
MADMFFARVAATPDAESLRYPTNPGWKSLTWKQVGTEVRALACGLHALGLGMEQRVAIVSNTRWEWIVVDLAILCAGGATTTIYPSSTADDCAYIISDSATVIAVVENESQVAKLVARRAELPALRQVIVIDGEGGHDGWVITLAEVAERGRAADRAAPGRYEEIARAVGPTSLATLIYTSGTTGRPKGVELTHDCWLYEGEGVEATNIFHASDVQYMWLPLSHSFGKVLEAAVIRIGIATVVDGRVDKIIDNLAEVKPTFVAAVPRIFEKVHNKVVSGAQQGGATKYAIFKWAFGVGRQVSALRRAGKAPGTLLLAQHALAHKLVFSRLQERFGGRLRFFVSGSAPLAKDLAEFFHAAGVLILEGYGLTETSAAAFVNRTDAYRLGTVGLPLPGTEVKIAEDGEILLRGRGVMRGYHKMEEATREVFDPEGWLRTGDIGELEDGGFLRITDRKKDLIKTSGGKYVAPQSIEGKLKSLCPWVSQVVVHGDNRNFCTALVTLDEEAVRSWATQHGKDGVAMATLAKDADVVALVQAGVDQLNRGLAKYETIKKFAVLPAELTQEAGELTASLKVKRKVVEQKYRAILDAFYAGANAAAE